MAASRRQFLFYAGFGTYSLLAGGISTAQSRFPLLKRRGRAPGFKPIYPTLEDAYILPSGFRHDMICAWGDDLGSHGPEGGEKFGFNNDFVAYFPIHALNGGRNPNDGLLFESRAAGCSI